MNYSVLSFIQVTTLVFIWDVIYEDFSAVDSEPFQVSIMINDHVLVYFSILGFALFVVGSF